MFQNVLISNISLNDLCCTHNLSTLITRRSPLTNGKHFATAEHGDRRVHLNIHDSNSNEQCRQQLLHLANIMPILILCNLFGLYCVTALRRHAFPNNNVCH